MSGGNVAQGAVYSPLPQTISDTDSSEEELNSVLHSSDSYPVNRKLTAPGKVPAKNGQKMGEYRQLGHDGETELSLNGVSTQESLAAEDVLVVKPERPVCHSFRDMSPLRKFFFLGSIAMCGVTVLVFLWVLPCDWATCPSTRTYEPPSRSWERTLVGLELKGAISIVPGVRGRSRNLIFLLRGDVGNPNGPSTSGDEGVESFPVEGGGIISLVGSTGAIAWWKKMPSLPRDIDCSLLDVDGDGVDDCLVLGGGGLLVAVDPVSGAQWWNLRSASGKEAEQPTDLDFPLVVPDVDGDGVCDLLTACSLAHQRNSLLLVSGHSGLVLGSGVHIRACFTLHLVSLENLTVSYICQQGGKEAVREVGLVELYTQATNKPFPGTEHPAVVRQHRRYEGRAPGTGRSLTVSVAGRSLVLENSGRCPGRCRVAVNVTDRRAGARPLWNYTEEDAHGMVPVAAALANRSAEGPAGVFVVKLWHWGGREQPDGNGSRPVVRRLSESVVLVALDAAGVHVANASLSDVTQLCSQRDLDCQPDLSFQEQSLLIGDLDQDESQELISYLSTYSLRKQNSSSSMVWQLESKVRVIRLEAELPKLYKLV